MKEWIPGSAAERVSVTQSFRLPLPWGNKLAGFQQEGIKNWQVETSVRFCFGSSVRLLLIPIV